MRFAIATDPTSKGWVIELNDCCDSKNRAHCESSRNGRLWAHLVVAAFADVSLLSFLISAGASASAPVSSSAMLAEPYSADTGSLPHPEAAIPADAGLCSEAADELSDGSPGDAAAAMFES